jgi:hypothetical protein
MSLTELFDFTRTGPMAVRIKACETICGLTGGVDGRALLAAHGGPAALRLLVGSSSPALSALAVTALINLSADEDCVGAVVSCAGLVDVVMDALRDPACAIRPRLLMLLVNLAAVEGGAAAVMEGGGCAVALPGIHLRRLVQLFAEPVSPAAPEDAMEFAGAVLASVAQRADARALLLEPERRILPVFFPQLHGAASVVRRRGAAATLRNCCFEAGSEEGLRRLLAPGLGLLTALLLPLAGPARYSAEEAAGMAPALANAGAEKTREADPAVRRSLVEALGLLATARGGRDALRSAKAYYVVRAFHRWLEGVAEEDGEEDEKDRAAAARGVLLCAEPGGAAASGGGGGGGGARREPLCSDDEATVEAVYELVSQIFRTDEVPMGAPLPKPRARVDETGVEDAARRGDEEALRAAREAAASASQAAVDKAASQALRYATVSLEVAKEKARKVATGELHHGAEDA